MSRMFDRMLTQGFAPPWWANPALDKEFRSLRSDILELLGSTKVFNIDNVADYAYTSIEQERWTLSDLPNLAPPFPEFFMETRTPRQTLVKVDGRLQLMPSQLALAGWGVLVIGTQVADRGKEDVKLTPGPLHRGIGVTHPSLNVLQPQGSPDGMIPKWSLVTMLFIEEQQGHIFGPAVTWEFEVDAAGAFVQGPDIIGAAPPPGFPESEYWDWLSDAWGPFFYPALLSISFLHCKNVQVARQTPPRKLSRAFQRRHRRPLTQFHTLQITPMRKVLEREGQSQTLGLKKALHICRGHFKTFTPEGKLFGRYTGTYWWEAHVRGAQEHGIALKDYQVNQPAETSRADSSDVSLAL